MPQASATLNGIFRDRISAPGTRVKRLFSSLESGAGNLSAALGPLNSRFLALAAVFGTVQSIRSSIENAEKQVQAERKLLSALQGRKDVLEEIKAATAEIQRNSTFGDEVLIEQAASLKNAGFAAGDLVKTLQAAVDTAEALSVPLDLVTNSFLRFQQDQPGLLGRRLGDIERLREEGKLAAEGIDLLGEKFAGIAKEIASTPFGKSTQLANEFGDELERIGEILIRVKLSLQEGLVQLTEDFADFLESDLGQRSVNGIVRFTDALGRNSSTIAKILAGFLFLKTTFTRVIPLAFGLVRLVGKLNTGFGKLRLGTVLLGTIMFEAFDQVLNGDLSEALSDWIDKIKLAGKEFVKRQDEIGGLIGFAVLSFQNLGDAFDTFFFTPVTVGFSSFIKAAKAAFISVENLAVFAGIKIQEALPEFLGGISKKEATRRRNVFGEALRNDTERIKKILDQQLVDLNDSYEKNLISVEEYIEEYDELNGKILDLQGGILDPLIVGNDKIFTKIEGFLARSQARRQKLVEETEEKKTQKTKEEAAKREAEILKEEFRIEQAEKSRADLVEKLSKITLNRNEEAQEGIAARSLSSLEQDLEAQRLTYEEFAELRAQLLVGPLEEELAAQRAVTEEIREQIREVRSREGDVQEEVDILEKKLIPAKLEEQRITGEIYNLRQKFLEEAEDQQIESIEALGQASQDTAENFREAIGKIQSQIRQGAISQTLGGTLAEQEFQKYIEGLDGIRAQLEALKEQFPGLVNVIDEQIARLGENQDEVIPEGLKNASFADGFSQQFENTLNNLSNLKAQGQETADTLIQGFGDGFAVALTQGSKAFKQFASQFLLQLSQMLLKMALFNTLKSAFGFNDGGEVPEFVRGFSAGGPALKFDTGGRVPGPNVNADVVNAKLTPGEHVIRREAANDYYGHKIMSAINNMLIPRGLMMPYVNGGRSAKAYFNRSGLFAEGGGVPSGSGSSGVSRAFVVSDEQALDRMVKGGEQALLNNISENPSKFKAALGLE